MSNEAAITHSAIKIDGQEVKYSIKYHGAEIGVARKEKIDVTDPADAGKTKKVPGFIFSPGPAFESLDVCTDSTMKGLKETIAKAAVNLKIDPPKKAEPAPKATPAAKVSQDTVDLGSGDDAVDLSSSSDDLNL